MAVVLTTMPMQHIEKLTSPFKWFRKAVSGLSLSVVDVVSLLMSGVPASDMFFILLRLYYMGLCCVGSPSSCVLLLSNLLMNTRDF